MKSLKNTLIYLIVFSFMYGPAMAQSITVDRAALLQGRSGTQSQASSFQSTRTKKSPSNPLGLGSNAGMMNPTSLIPTQQINIHVLGDVFSPGVYKVAVSERLSSVLALAEPARENLRLVEIRHPGEKTRTYDLHRYFNKGELSQNPFLKENDVIFVPPARGSIRVEGPVTLPGLHELYREKTLSDVMKLAGGTTVSASKVHPIKVVRFSEGGQRSVIDVENNKDLFKKFKIEKGDIIVIPDIINNPADFDYSVETIPGENIVYPTATPNIFVVGKVIQPGPYPYQAHLKVKDYMSYAGPAPGSQLKSATIIRNGKKIRAKLEDSPKPGDIIRVRSTVSYSTVLGTFSTLLSLTLTILILEDRL
jgi:protein involved in polysaccharide export with SLBB domain